MLTSYTPQEPPLRPSLRGLRHNSYEIAGIDIPARMDTGQRQALAISHTPAYLTSSQGLPSSLPRSIYFSLNASSDVALLSVTGSASGQSTAVGQPMTAPTNNDPHTQQAQVPSASIQQAAVPASAGPIFIPAMLRSLFAPMSSGRSRPAALVRRSAHAPGHYSVLLPNAAQQVCTNPRAAGQHAPGMVRRHQQVLFAAVSDLHLERRAGSAVALGSLFSPHVLAHADVLALLGDIGDPASPAYKSFVTACALAFPLVLLVPGNHEYHTDEPGADMHTTRTGLQAFLDTLPNTVLMHKAAVTLERVLPAAAITGDAAQQGKAAALRGGAAAPSLRGRRSSRYSAIGGYERTSMQSLCDSSCTSSRSTTRSVLSSCMVGQCPAGGTACDVPTTTVTAGGSVAVARLPAGSSMPGRLSLRRDSAPLPSAAGSDVPSGGSLQGGSNTQTDASQRYDNYAANASCSSGTSNIAGKFNSASFSVNGMAGAGLSSPFTRRVCVRVLGSTLWSHIPDDTVTTPSGVTVGRHQAVASVLHDYKHVHMDGKLLTPAHVCALHAEHVAWLAAELAAAAAEGLRCGVLTHHVPTQAGTSHPRFVGSITGPTYSTSLEHLMGNAMALKPADTVTATTSATANDGPAAQAMAPPGPTGPLAASVHVEPWASVHAGMRRSLDFGCMEAAPHLALWMCGHTHYNFDLRVAGTRVVSNQWGYGDEAEGSYSRHFLAALPLA